MWRFDLIHVLAGVGGLAVLLLTLSFIRALFLRWRRKRQAAQAWREPAPQAVPDVGPVIQKEAPRSLEAEWHRDGEIELRRKRPEEESP